MFANEYVQTAHTIPFVIKGEAVPDNIVAKDKRVNNLMLSLLVTISVIMYSCDAVNWWTWLNDGQYLVWAAIFNLLWLVVGLLLFVSCICLLLSVN